MSHGLPERTDLSCMDCLKEYGYKKIAVFGYAGYIKNDIEADGYIHENVHKIHMYRYHSNMIGRKFLFPADMAMEVLTASDNFDMLTLKAEQVILRNQFKKAFGKV